MTFGHRSNGMLNQTGYRPRFTRTGLAYDGKVAAKKRPRIQAKVIVLMGR